MDIIVDQDTCISCGACISTSPAVYQFNDDNKAVAIVDQVPADKGDEAKAGRDACPVDAIDIKE
jgi:ferredoxin